MNETIEAAKESARAIGKISDTTAKALDLARDASRFVGRVLGDVPRDLVGILGGDWLAIKRQKRILTMAQITTQLLLERGVINTITVPMNLGVPLLESGSLEEEEAITEL